MKSRMIQTAIRSGCILAAFFASVLAQAPGNRPPDKPASPASLPGDTLPPFGMLDSALARSGAAGVKKSAAQAGSDRRRGGSCGR